MSRPVDHHLFSVLVESVSFEGKLNLEIVPSQDCTLILKSVHFCQMILRLQSNLEMGTQFPDSENVLQSQNNYC